MVKQVLKPTILYPNLIMSLIKDFKVNSISHITGGGLLENLPRSIPNNLSIEIDETSWEIPKIFQWLKEEGNLSNNEMYRIFNCGIGMALFVEKDDSSKIMNKILQMGHKCFQIGVVSEKKDKDSIKFF